MTAWKRDPAPDAGPGWYVADEKPIPRRDFTKANGLYEFPLDEGITARLDCPDCDMFCNPDNLGEAVDWALGHECEAVVAA